MTTSPPVLIGIDWGSTSFRAYRIAADGTVIDMVEAAEGITNPPPEGFEHTFDNRVGPWLRDHPGLPVVASGMITSRNGWFETGYVDAPAGASELAEAMVAHVTETGLRLHFAPGLICRDRSGNPDVMRGEETQLVGCLALGVPDGIFVMPGTHSKWATSVAGVLTGFQTYMTGEVFAVMMQHSLLGALAEGEDWSDADFSDGIKASLAGRDPLLHLMFTARSRVLTGDMAATGTRSYLSGLLIGEELRAGLGDVSPGSGVTVVGAGALVDRYVAALSICGVKAPPAPDAAVARGHFEIAKHAGLLT